MDDNLTYGMLMRRISVNDDMHILIPVHLISGMMIGDNVFADTLGKDYLVFTPGADLGDEIYFDEEYYIGHTVTVEELKNTYPNDSLDNAEMYFYEEARKYCLICMLYEEEFKYVYLNMNKMFDEYINVLSQMNNDNSVDIDINIDFDNFDLDNNFEEDEEHSIYNFVALTGSEVDSLIELTNKKDYKELIEKLKKYKDSLEMAEETYKKEFNADDEQVAIEESNDNVENIINDEIDVKDFYEKTKKKIIGQDEAIKNIIIAAKMDQYAKTPSEKNRCFIIGPTGTGKTELVKCLGEYLNKPTIKVDTTQLTTPGYVGGTLEDTLAKLVNVAGGDIKKAENGIIAFDEIDKKCGNEDKLFGQGFLYTLLPFLDGTDYTINIGGKKVNFNTSNLTIFASGSFSEIIKNSSLDKKSIGFNVKSFSSESPYLNPDEIFKRASMPEELIGRFPVVIQLNPHTEESLSKILVQSDISQLKAEQRKFKHLGVNLEWEEKYIEAVAKEAIKANIGARSLKKIVEKSIKEISWEVLTNPNKYTSATLLEETVKDPKIYRLK